MKAAKWRREQRMRSVIIRLGIIAAWLVAQSMAQVFAADPTADLAREEFLFAPTIPNKTPPPGPAPGGAVWVPGGEFSMGSKDVGGPACEGMRDFLDSRPIHRVYVDGFWMDETDVTNEQFEKFVKASGYITIAERAPTKEELPMVPQESLIAGSLVFTPTTKPVPLTDHYQWWSYVPGANWRHPEGPNSDLKGKEKYPVVQIAYDDAVAYAKWTGKRLPTEAEWEFAARGGLSGKFYTWGDEFKPGGKFMANTWQGTFPVKDTGEDGFAGIAPVKSFPANGYGLYDMAGNVWQWVSDWYRADYFQQLADAGGVAQNPQGARTPLGRAEKERVHKGGSFLCTDQYCSAYLVGRRGKGDVSTGTNHLGFRCVREARKTLAE